MEAERPSHEILHLRPGNEDVYAVTIYSNEAEARLRIAEFEKQGVEAYLCEYGYPFA